MNNYEMVMILNNKAENKEKIIEDYKKYVESFANLEADVNIWGEKQLAYNIKNEKYGYYVVIKYVAEKDHSVDLDKKLRADDNVLKYIVVKNDAYVYGSRKVANEEKNRNNEKELER